MQFNAPAKYQQIYAGEVWALFRSAFPHVEEHPAIPPTFETFGGQPGVPFRFGFIPGASHDRFWFLSPNREELIQFQADRLLHNWRKVGDSQNPYPRFESMIKKFESELQALEGYFATLAPQPLNINQCEITYINHIVPQDKGNPSAWLRIVNFPDGDPQGDFSLSIRDVIRNSEGKPISRLFVESSTGVGADGKPIILLNLTIRGTPAGTGIKTAIQFLSDARERMGAKFVEITTQFAQQKWERLQ